jgi:site-specific DNA recombinase
MPGPAKGAGSCGLAIHGCGFTRTAGGVERRYYRCAGVDALTTGRDTKCPRAMIDAEVIEQAVWDHVVGLLSDPQRLVAQFERFVAETADGSPQDQAMARQLQARLDRLARADQRLLEAYQAEVISLEELAERRRTITEQHCAAVQQRDQRRRLVEQRVRAHAVLANVTAFSERICSRLKDADFSDRQAILQLIVERIIVHEDTLEIRHVIPLRDPDPADGPTRPAMPPNTGLRSDGLHPTGGLEDRPRLALQGVEPVEPGVGVGLQDAGEGG